MWLVLCERGDLAAMWALRGLRDRGFASVEIVTGDEIACALRVAHRVGAAGVSTELDLARGLTISSATARGVLNRLMVPPAVAQAAASSADREYACQEMLAITLSWIYGLACPVLGRPTPQGMCGPWFHRSEWVALAGRAGLATVPYHRSSLDDPDDGLPGLGSGVTAHRTLFCVADGERVGTTGAAIGAPASIGDSCLRLARLAGATFLGIEFAPDWTFMGASPRPDLLTGGAPLLDLIAASLGSTAQGSR